MYHRKKDNTTIWNNCTFNHDTRKGYSYNWWQVSGVFNGVKVFNNYSYSNTTSKHQNNIYKLLSDNYSDNNILIVKAPKGLQAGLPLAIEYHKTLIEDLRATIAKKGTRATTNARRQEKIKEHENTISKIEKLLV